MANEATRARPAEGGDGEPLNLDSSLPWVGELARADAARSLYGS